jgi:Na+/H+ antiporter NhaD/arsenite permease-like protein
MNVLALLLVLAIIANFTLMARGVLAPYVGMTLTALIALAIVGFANPSEALQSAQSGAAGFARVAILFTAIAAPSHMLARGEGLDKLGLWLGESIGWLAARGRDGSRFTRAILDPILLIVFASIFLTWMMAAMLHNTTAILISAGVVSALCRSYGTPAVPVLSGTLVASNLGGFSTRWGDTPNIIEAHTWGLRASAFATEILPVNLLLLFLLATAVYIITRIRLRRLPTPPSSALIVSHAKVQFRSRKRNVHVNVRLTLVGIIGLACAISGTTLFSRYEIATSVTAILFCVALDYGDSREEGLFALGGETYATLAAIFIVANVVASRTAGIGRILSYLLRSHHGNLPLIIGVSYLGTLLTEAGSWATAAAPIVHAADTSVSAAWALGAGICAGSSSLITAATAGVILLRETRANREGERITFGNYVGFGLLFSLFMVVFYSIALTLLNF